VGAHQAGAIHATKSSIRAVGTKEGSDGATNTKRARGSDGSISTVAEMAAQCALEAFARLPPPTVNFATGEQLLSVPTGSCVDFAGVIIDCEAVETAALGQRFIRSRERWLPASRARSSIGAFGLFLDARVAADTIASQVGVHGSFRAGRGGDLGGDSAAMRAF